MKTNKPQWLIDAEKELEKFNNSKYGKMSEKEYIRSETSSIHGGVMNYVKNNPEHQKKAFNALLEKNPNHQSEAGKKGGPLGGKASKAKIISELGEEGAKEYWKQMGNNIYENMEDKKTWHMAGNKKSIENRRKALDLVLDSIIAELPNTEFSKLQVSDIMIKYGKGPSYFSDVLRQRPDSFQMVGKITQSKGGSTKLYKKI